MGELVIANEEGIVKSQTPKVTAIHPYGGTLLVEILNPDEILGTSLYIDKDAKVGSLPQAYVVEVGSGLKEDVGLKIGDRVMLQGKYNPVENIGSNTDRQWAIIELHSVKAVLEE
jgi:hypothetical protein